jgi:hypothetical protein
MLGSNSKIKKMHIQKSFEFLEKENGYTLVEIENDNFFDVICAIYKKENCNDVQIIYERGYYDFEIKINDEYISLALIYRYFFQNSEIRLYYPGDNGFKNLVNDVKKYFSICIERLPNISLVEIRSFYHKNPVYRLNWL